MSSNTPPAASMEGPLAPRYRPRELKVIGPPSNSLSEVLRHLKELRHYVDLLYVLSVHRIKVRYKQSILGVGWAVVQPLSLMLIYTLIFAVFAKMPSDGAPYALFTYAALLLWSFFSTTVTNSTGSLVGQSSLVTKVYFPREVLPLTYVVVALFDFLIASVMLGGLMLYYQVPITIYALYSIPIIFTLVCFAVSAALFLSSTQVRHRDFTVAVPLLLQIWMFATPVVYPLSAVPDRLRGYYILNPTVGIIENFRRVIVQGVPPDFPSLGVALLVALILLPLSYVYFKRVEATLADII